MLTDLIPGALVWALVLLLVFDRQRLLRKTRDWRPIIGTVTDSRTRLLGEAIALYVDVTFFFDGTNTQVGNVLTDGDRIADYPEGCQIRLLVDPKNARNCMLEKLSPSAERTYYV